MANLQQAPVTDAFERALGTVLARVAVSERGEPGAYAVAYSGGLDSAALLQLASEHATAKGMVLYAFHVHHGLSPNADHWETHCRTECEKLGVHFDSRRVELTGLRREGIEQAARIRRYAALGEMCRLHRVPLLLTAHHRDDQAETVLLQLLRGSGVAGMSGMDFASTAPTLLGGDTPLLARPLLDLTRAELEAFVAHRGINHIEDESNRDPRYTRNALRHAVMPALDRHFPGFQARIARAARHAQVAQRLLDELAQQDLAQCLAGECIEIARLQDLGPDRIDNLLRYWLSLHGVRMPAAAWLDEMRTQLLDAREDAQVRVTHADCEIRRHRGRIFLTPRERAVPHELPPLDFRWQGEPCIRFEGYCGILHFDACDTGVDAAWLRTQELKIRHRSGGEILKLAPNRPGRSLKQHYQAFDIPSWQRERLPIVMAGEKILYAAGVGMDCRAYGGDDSQAIQLRWERIGGT